MKIYLTATQKGTFATFCPPKMGRLSRSYKTDLFWFGYSLIFSSIITSLSLLVASAVMSSVALRAGSTISDVWHGARKRAGAGIQSCFGMRDSES